MLAHFPIEQVFPVEWQASQWWPDHLVILSNGNRVPLCWNEVECADCRDYLGRWMPRAPQPGDTLIVDEDGIRMAVITENAWRWRQREDCRRVDCIEIN